MIEFIPPNGEELLNLLSIHEIDVLLLDLFMPKMNGKELMQILSKKYPSIRTIVISFCVDEQLVNEMLDLGIYGYLSKSTDFEELMEAIKCVRENEVFRNKIISDSLYWKINRTGRKKGNHQINLSDLQIKLIQLLWEEKSTHEIAQATFTSVSTVEKIKQHLKEKTGTKTNIGLIKYALDHRIILTATEYKI